MPLVAIFNGRVVLGLNLILKFLIRSASANFDWVIANLMPGKRDIPLKFVSYKLLLFHLVSV